jgi:hypothetical protein
MNKATQKGYEKVMEFLDNVEKLMEGTRDIPMSFEKVNMIIKSAEEQVTKNPK